jgi:glycosyltransferase involved in cell wall biosynthesis
VNATATAPSIGNVLLVANFPSDTAYAWWLMEEFWTAIGDFFIAAGGRAYLAYPQVSTLSERIQQSRLEVVTLTVPGHTLEERASADEFVRQQQIRTIYFTDRPWFNLDYARLRRAGVRNILIHDHTPGDRPPVTGLKRLVKASRNRMPGFTADYMFCVSPLMRERDITNGCIPAARCLVVQNGIRPLKAPPDRKALRASLGIPSDTFVVITTGRAHPYKRFDFVISTAAALRDTQPELKVLFLLIGDGPAFDHLQRLVTELDLGSRVRLLGYRSDTQQVLFAADAAMHAALGEGFSLSIVEYMSAGLPVLVPDIPSVSQAITDGIEGFVYPSNSGSAACERLERLIRDPRLASAMSVRSKKRADTSFTLDNTLTSLKAHIESIHRA